MELSRASAEQRDRSTTERRVHVHASPFPDGFPYDVAGRVAADRIPTRSAPSATTKGPIAGADVTDVAVDCVDHRHPTPSSTRRSAATVRVTSPGVHGGRAVAIAAGQEASSIAGERVARPATSPTAISTRPSATKVVVTTGLDAGFFDDASDVAIQTRRPHRRRRRRRTASKTTSASNGTTQVGAPDEVVRDARPRDDRLQRWYRPRVRGRGRCERQHRRRRPRDGRGRDRQRLRRRPLHQHRHSRYVTFDGDRFGSPPTSRAKATSRTSIALQPDGQDPRRWPRLRQPERRALRRRALRDRRTARRRASGTTASPSAPSPGLPTASCVQPDGKILVAVGEVG